MFNSLKSLLNIGRGESSSLRASLKQAFIRDLDATEISKEENTLYFDYIPEEITDSKTANYNLIDIPGRSEPIVGYINSSLREFSLHLIFLAGVGQAKQAGFYANADPSKDPDSATVVKQKVDWLRSLVHPDYSNPNFVRPPHKIFLGLGKLIRSTCVVGSVNATYKGPWDRDLLPYLAEVDVSFQEVNEVPPGVNEVRRGTLGAL